MLKNIGIFFILISCLGVVNGQSSDFYAYASLQSKTLVGVNTYNLTLTKFNGGVKLYPNANLYTVNDLHAGQVMFFSCYRYTIKQVVQISPTIVVQVTDTTGTNLMTTDIPINSRTVIAQERYVNGVPISIFLNIADVNSGTLSGLGSQAVACINDYYYKSFLKLFGTNALQGIETRICGAPAFQPSNGYNNYVVDTCNGNGYVWNNVQTKWYNATNIESASAPQLQYTNGSMTISNTHVFWYNTTNSLWYQPTNTGWITQNSFGLDSLLHAANIWTGRNIFTDTAVFSKSIISNGIISIGTIDKSATQINGVQSDKLVQTSSDLILDGTTGVVFCTPVSADINLTLPIPQATTKGWVYKVSKQNGSVYKINILENNSSFTAHLLSTGMTLNVRCDGVQWLINN